MNHPLYNKKFAKNQEACGFSGSVAVQFHEPFNPFQTYHLEQFEQNLKSLQEKASFLSFMVGEIKGVLDSSKLPLSRYRTS